MGEDQQIDQQTMDSYIQAKLATQGDTTTASPSVPYVKYIMQDDFVPDLPPSLRAVVYDKELALTNLKEGEIEWLRKQLIISEIMYKGSRPALACSQAEEITLAAVPGKLLVKLTRSRDGGFERRQQTTQTVIRRVETSNASVPGRKSGWRVFGRSVEK
jgi:hypothetical protein